MTDDLTTKLDEGTSRSVGLDGSRAMVKTRRSMTPEHQYEYERDRDICLQEIALAEMAVKARNLLDIGYGGHGRKQYEWQASQLIEHLETALRFAQKLPPYSA